MAKLFANSGDPDQTPRSAASDLGLHCLPITLLRVSQLQWVNNLCLYLKLLVEWYNVDPDNHSRSDQDCKGSYVCSDIQ